MNVNSIPQQTEKILCQGFLVTRTGNTVVVPATKYVYLGMVPVVA